MAKETTSASAPQQEADDMRPMAIQSSAAISANKSPWMRTLVSPWFLIPLSLAGLALLAVVFRPNALQGGGGIKQTQVSGKDMGGHSGSGGMHMGNKNNEQFEEEDEHADDNEPFVPSLITAEKELLDYYKGNDLSQAFAIGSTRGLQYLASKIAKRKQESKPFVIGAIGNGDIVGGLSNCHADSYLPVMERTLKPAFEEKGMKLEIRQVAFGPFCGEASKSAQSCIESLLGTDVDLLHYSFTRAPDTVEARELLGSVASGSVHIIELDCVGHAQSLSKGKNALLLQKYADYGSDVICLEDALQTIMGEAYKGRSWGLVGDGMHRKSRESSSGVVWRSWIPGPLGHQFLADVFSLQLFRALRLSETIKADSVVGSPPPPGPRALPKCTAFHTPSFGPQQITVTSAGKWRRLPGVKSEDDDIPEKERNDSKCIHQDSCGYYEGRGAIAGEIAFDISADSSLPHRGVYVCCCCNSELCVAEQFRSHVTFKWEKPVENADQEKPSLVAGPECLRVASNMPFANKLRISIQSQIVDVPVRIAKVIAG